MSVDAPHGSLVDGPDAASSPASARRHAPHQAVLLFARIAPHVFPDAVGVLVRQSRSRSQVAGVDGALLCDGERVAYGAEGHARAVDDWIDGLRRDPRHVGLSLLWRGTLERRAFDDGWRVGWVGAEVLDRLEAAAPARSVEAVRGFVDAVGASDAW